ncbi:unnamed protein product [Euphydryas editha]|uniref:Uncharacterized protein n=1 Tax=Euphydryas editha TaxID=104508 RepID=A0AAU9TCY5_EUPED|nr:unnamed protein product [Euphydryas editha]
MDKSTTNPPSPSKTTVKKENEEEIKRRFVGKRPVSSRLGNRRRRVVFINLILSPRICEGPYKGSTRSRAE